MDMTEFMTRFEEAAPHFKWKKTWFGCIRTENNLCPIQAVLMHLKPNESPNDYVSKLDVCSHDAITIMRAADIANGFDKLSANLREKFLQITGLETK